MSNVNERQFPVGHAIPLDKSGRPLTMHPDVSAPNGVDVHSMSHLRTVIGGKSAHRYDEATDGFKKARIHEWQYRDHKQQSTSYFPAGGRLEDESH